MTHLTLTYNSLKVELTAPTATLMLLDVADMNLYFDNTAPLQALMATCEGYYEIDTPTTSTQIVLDGLVMFVLNHTEHGAAFSKVFKSNEFLFNRWLDKIHASEHASEIAYGA